MLCLVVQAEEEDDDGNSMESPSECMLLKFGMPSITFTLINSRETASNNMMNPRMYKRYGSSVYGSSAGGSSRYHPRYRRTKSSSKGLSNLPPIDLNMNPHSHRSPHSHYKSSRGSSVSSHRSGYYHSHLGPQSVR